MISVTEIKEHVKIRISSDLSEAFLYGPLPTDFHLDLDQLNEYLVQSGVKSGILNIPLASLEESLSEVSPVLIARGTQPINGEDGWIEYFFNTSVAKPETDSNGKVNLHDLHFIHNVKKGDKLALIHLPTEGIPGVKVTGELIPPRGGNKPEIHLGDNVSFSNDDSCFVIADVDGNVTLKANKSIDVQPIVTIRGNIDYSTGNIDFIGSLIVTGDILADFSVKVDKDLTVYGSVEDTSIEVGGNVIVKKGFIGTGKGIINAKGNVTVHNLLNQTIISNSDVTIEKEAVSGTIKAGGKIIAPRATVVGTFLESDIEATICNLGNKDGASVRVRVGKKGRILEHLAHIEKEVKATERQIIEVKDAIYRLIRVKIDKGCLGEDCEQKLIKLQEIQKLLPKKIDQMHKEKNDLTLELEKQFDGRIIVRGTVFENIHLEINGVKKMIENAIRCVMFVERGGELEARALEV